MNKILFICMGNICRSPCAEAVMNSIIKKKGMEDKIVCDSAGTIDYHRGNPADSRMKEHAFLRGYDLHSISRPFEIKDFTEFDMIITMDKDNYLEIRSRDFHKQFHSKILPITNFCKQNKVEEIPDPYYGGNIGFENVLDLLEDACEGLFEYILANK